MSDRLVRLPLLIGIEEHLPRIIDAVNEVLTSRKLTLRV